MKIGTRFLQVSFLATAALALLTACSSAADSSKTDKRKAETIVIATDGATKPFDYSENNKLTGYDIEVARAVFKNLPQYKVKFQTTDFATIVTGIDSGRYQIGANDFGWTSEREKKYYFSSPLSKSDNAIAVKSNAKTYKNLSDLADLSTEVNSASNYAKILRDFNDKNPEKSTKINYISGQSPFSNRLSDVATGKIDFILYDAISLKQSIKDMGFDGQLKVEKIEATSSDAEHDGYEYFLFAKTDEGKKLQTAVNAELKKLEADGTLKQLSEKYLGDDFVPDADKF
ncbi:MAG: transporter substrate-binding domain-containing protein [Streptococcaceae bacterium]|jgi:polar amino acid transport system substrate-binding protein|nr:transporter substrate-binding domain-containing protein [Streptococcaceae bacterium]